MMTKKKFAEKVQSKLGIANSSDTISQQPSHNHIHPLNFIKKHQRGQSANLSWTPMGTMHPSLSLIPSSVFNAEEQVQMTIGVKKLKKKKKAKLQQQTVHEYLSLIVQRGQRARVYYIKELQLVNSMDTNRSHNTNSYVVKQTFKLEDLHRFDFYKSVDANNRPNELEFVLHFDKPYIWAANSTPERNEFLSCMWKLCEQYLKKLPQTSIDMVELKYFGTDGVRVPGGPKTNGDITHSYKELMSPAEEKELETLLNSCVMGIADIDELADHLTGNLVKLEVENIYGIIEAENAVRDILTKVNNAEDQLDEIDAWLNDYNTQLKHMKQYIEHIESKNNRMEVVTRNHRKLLDTVTKLLRDLQLNEQAVKLLSTPNLQVGPNLQQVVEAAVALEGIFTVYNSFSDHIKSIQAVKEKMEEYHVLKDKFAFRANQFIQDLFSKVASAYLENNKSKKEKDVWNAEEHIWMTKQLLPYKELVHWLKRMDRKKFEQLAQAYVHSLKGVYKREIKEFFSELRHYIHKDHKDRSKLLASFVANTKKNEETGNSKALSRSSSSSSLSLMSSNTNTTALTELHVLKLSEKMAIDQAFAYCLTVVVPIVIEENNFCSQFFFYDDADKPTLQQLPTDQKKGNNPELPVDENVDVMLFEIFGRTEGILNELHNLVEMADKYDHYYTLTTLVAIENYTSSHRVTPFVSKLLDHLEKKINQLFNKFIHEQIGHINAAQVNIKRCGILLHISKFPSFVDLMEAAVGQSKKARAVLEPTYDKVILSLFGWLKSLTDAPEKYKYICRFENFHHLKTKIAERKIPCLAEYVRQAEDSYNLNLKNFVALTINNKFKNLTTFVDGIDQLMKSLSANEIQFQVTYNKQALAKVVSQHTAAKIEKKFTKIMKSLQKNLSHEEDLINEVWAAITEHFKQRYQHFEQLVQQVYKNQQLAFTSNDLVQLTARIKERNTSVF